MLMITKSKGTCRFCKVPAKKAINGLALCTDCADRELVRIITTAGKEIESAKVTIKILPKGAV